MRTLSGEGLINTVIDKLPIELHLPGYSYCGPGTKLRARLARGDRPINKLDSYCKEHDIQYSKYKDLENRHHADNILQERAWERVKAKDSSFGEKGAAWLVTTTMKAKRKLGMGTTSNKKKSCRRKIPKKTGVRRKNIKSFNTSIVNNIKSRMQSIKGSSLKDNVKLAVKVARKALRSAGGKKNINVPRVIRVPKIGGILPLIPIFAGLSALGALSGGVAGVTKSIMDAKAARKSLEESKRHNTTMEAIALGKKKKEGGGLYLKPHKTGYGLYIKKWSKNFQ